jgi:hypothetical protein
MKILANVTDVKGKCSADHTVDESFEISCHNPAGLRGFFYNKIFPNLQTFQFGGCMPWWKGDNIQLQSP